VYSIALRLALGLRLRLGRVAHCDLQPHTTRSRSSRDSTVESTRRPNEDENDTDDDDDDDDDDERVRARALIHSFIHSLRDSRSTIDARTRPDARVRPSSIESSFDRVVVRSTSRHRSRARGQWRRLERCPRRRRRRRRRREGRAGARRRRSGRRAMTRVRVETTTIPTTTRRAVDSVSRARTTPCQVSNSSPRARVEVDNALFTPTVCCDGNACASCNRRRTRRIGRKIRDRTCVMCVRRRLRRRRRRD